MPSHRAGSLSHPAGPGVPSALGAVPSAIGLSLGWTRVAIELSLPRRDGPGGVSMSTGRLIGGDTVVTRGCDAKV